MLEETVNGLRDLPERVATLATRLDEAVSTLSTRIDSVESTLSTRIDSVESTLSARIDSVESTLSARIDSVESTLSVRIDRVEAAMGRLERSLREEIRAGDDETRRFMRMLHEDLIGRIALLSERLH